jgi:Ni/Fe-hydrogenase 1 B-type cytochrome subunit
MDSVQISKVGPETQITLGDRRPIALYVWEWPVRLAHWLLVLSLVVLTLTGFYMHGPMLEAHSSRAWVMGTVRFIHECGGFFLIAVLILRLYWFVYAGNQWATWRSFFPLRKRQWVGAVTMLSYYTFRRREPDLVIGHNFLAAMTYLVIFSLLSIECLTGLILFNGVSHEHVLGFFVGWIPQIIDIQYIRMMHFLIMFLFMAFLVHHVYSAVLVSLEEKNGLMESIFSGWKFVPRKLLDEENDLLRSILAHSASKKESRRIHK